MYSSENLERFYLQYQYELLSKDECFQSFHKRNKVPYNIFQKWYKDTRNKIVEVKVDGRPEEPSSSYALHSLQIPSDTGNKEREFASGLKFS